jgi:hypothetical protein
MYLYVKCSMNSNRQQYKAEWIARKRRKLQARRKLALADLDTSDSDNDESSMVQRHELTGLVASTSHSVDDLCNDLYSSSSLDESFSDAETQCWNVIDQACNYYSDSSESESVVNSPAADFKGRLQAWAVDQHVTHSQLDSLLPILRDLDKSLPKNGKTLLKCGNEEQSKVISRSGGDYIYLGVRDGLTDVLVHNSTFMINSGVIELALNIDGLPLFRSSSYSLWPILCSAVNVNPSSVFVVALYGGLAKPANLDFLNDTIEELGKLLREGFYLNDKHFNCILKLCVCDAPARAMVKCIKQFSGYYGCDKCMQKGEYDGRVIYPECRARLRDNDSFRQHSNEEHHTGVSPFCDLPVDMITFFPIDYMHQVCLGVMKRLLLCWTAGSRKVRLSLAQKSAVNTRLQLLRRCVTNDFNRKPRTLNELAHWKATEFRTFLLYIGYFVVHKIVSDQVLEHFLFLSVAIRLLVCEEWAKDSDRRSLAHELLVYFVEEAVNIYGREFLVYNVHTLVHICKEAEFFGCLDNSSAFIFENFMQVLKKSAHSGRNPITQVCRRLKERSLYSSQSTLKCSTEQCELQHLPCITPDNCCILVDDGRCCQIVSKSQQYITCMIFNDSEAVFDSPVDSRFVGVHKVKLSRGLIKRLPLTVAVQKAICCPELNGDYVIFIQLLHAVATLK